MLDFCFLAGRDAKFFLFKHADRFGDFVFFLEVELADGSFLTIRRSVAEASKISFKKHANENQDFSTILMNAWDHPDVPFEPRKRFVGQPSRLESVEAWPYRKGLGYLVRSQDDFRDVFHLRKFANVHSDWKPFLAHILGFKAELVTRHYGKEQELADKQATAQTVKQELGGSIEDASKIDGKDPRILIVTDKLLTGYDAPLLYCLYLDKPMRDHVLLQAVARVNRPYVDKEGIRKRVGLVVDFVGVLHELKKAYASTLRMSKVSSRTSTFFCVISSIRSQRPLTDYLDAGDGGDADERLERLV